MRPARTILRGEAGFPPPLAAIDQAPTRLRVAGDLGALDLPRVALVGSRESDGYGLEMARTLARDLARAGVSIVSGGARGVDGAAHLGALEAGGHTLAVLGTGLGVDYPAEHGPLFDRILAGGGALVSEYDDGAGPRGGTFPRRNRIISGLCQAVVVVRAAARSGALVTAGWARRQGRALLAVPGEAGDPLAEGTLELLRQGAGLAAGAADVLAALGRPRPGAEAPAGTLPLPLPAPAAAPELDGTSAAVYAALTRSPRHVGEVAAAAGLSPGAALAALLTLELGGLAEQRPGQRFARRGAQPRN